MDSIELVLLVDDSETDIFFQRREIEKANIVKEILIANDGRQALELLTTPVDGEYPCPEIIFLDVNMPLMNGWEFLEAFMAIDLPTANPPTIYMLSHSMNPEDSERAEKIEIVKEFLTKYLTREKLLSIKEGLEKDRQLS